MNELFEPFAQVERTLSRKRDGVGLGLAITKNLVELMGGKIWAESIPGQGTTFSFTIQAETEEIELVQRLIMVFDNEQDNYRKLIDYLSDPRPIEFEDEGIQFEQAKAIIEPWRDTFFPRLQEHFGSNLLQDIFSIARHIAQRDEPPKFFKFEERDDHDLDKIAEDLIEENSDN
jgi:hypothetical protein